jgi:hypothetical protein
VEHQVFSAIGLVKLKAVSWFQYLLPVIGILMFFLVGILVAQNFNWAVILVAGTLAILLAIICKSIMNYVYLFLAVLLMAPKFRDVPGVATVRLDEFLVFPLLILVLVLYQGRGGMILKSMPKVFISTFGVYALTTFISLAADAALIGQPFQFKIMLSLLQLAAVFLVVYYALLLEPARLSRAIKILFLLAGVVMAIGLAQHFKIANIDLLLRSYYSRDTLTSLMGYSRITSVFEGNPVNFGSFIVLTNSMTLAWYIWKRGRRAGMLMVVMLLFSSYILFLSVAKWAIFVQLVMGLSFIFLGKKSLDRKLLIPVIAVVIMYLGMLTFPQALDRLATLDGSYMGRSRAYSDAMTVFNSDAKTLLFGYGFRSSWIAEGQYSFELYRKGLIGFIGFSIFVLGQLIYLMRYSRAAEQTNENVFLFRGGLGVYFAALLLAIPYAPIEADRVREWLFVWLAIVYACAFQYDSKHATGWKKI